MYKFFLFDFLIFHVKQWQGCTSAPTNRPCRYGGGLDPLLRYMPEMFLSRVGSALPPSSTVKSMHPRHYLLTKSEEIASNFSRNESEKKYSIRRKY